MFDWIASDLAQYDVVLEPDTIASEWWAGAPSVLRARDGAFYLTARMRGPIAPKGQRGYEIRILRSEDARRFEPIHRITREAAGVPAFERSALVQDPATGRFRLYSCTQVEGRWAIIRFDDADDPAGFKADSARPVLRGETPDELNQRVHGYKDPVMFWDGARWRMFVIALDRIERIGHFVSEDGEQWRPAGDSPLLENAGWHNFHTRPACLLPLAVGFLFVYEGSNLAWHDPNYNIATGLAYSGDMQSFVDLTPHAPLLRSTTPSVYTTWRYSHWLRVGAKIHVYFEAARADGANELRLGVLSPCDTPFFV